MESLKNRARGLLRQSEQYTGTDMVYLVKGGFWLGLSQILASATGFALLIVLANILSPETLGEYRFLTAGFLILLALALPGMHTALLESTPKGYPGNITTAFRAMMRWGFLGALASLATAAYYFLQNNIPLSVGFAVIALSLPLFGASQSFFEYLKAIKEFKKFTAYTAITRSLMLVVTVLAAIAYPEQAWAILAAFLAANIIPNLFFHKKVVNEFAGDEAPSDPEIVPYAKHLSVMAAFGMIVMQADKVFVWNFLGAEELAVFFIAQTIPVEISRFLQLVPNMAFPKFAAAGAEATRKTLLPKMLKFLLVIGAGTAAYIVAAPFIFRLLFPQYMAAVPYSQVIMLYSIAMAFSPIITYLTVHKRKFELYILTALVPAVSVGAAVFLVAFFGIWGAVYAFLLEALLRTIVSLFFFIREK